MSRSSLGNRPATSPVVRMALMYSRNSSLTMSKSVRIHVVRLPSLPTATYSLPHVVQEVSHLVRARDLDLEHLLTRDVGGEPGQRLTAAAAHSDQQGVAARHADDAADAHHVLQRVREQHQRHGLHARLRVVLAQELLHSLPQRLEVGRRLVHLGRVLQHLLRLLVHHLVAQEVHEVAVDVLHARDVGRRLKRSVMTLADRSPRTTSCPCGW